ICVPIKVRLAAIDGAFRRTGPEKDAGVQLPDKICERVCGRKEHVRLMQRLLIANLNLTIFDGDEAGSKATLAKQVFVRCIPQ
ncbi:MAG: hypothetical protein IAG10_33755, partial [Planctomycetaceae bacterium]|nr:hypothetical protein [Planctomycetaceae bacterium]